jgi:hypothetical protein
MKQFEEGALLFRLFGLHDHVVKGEIPHIATRVGSRRIVKGNTRAFETFKNDLKELSLLWVHVGCFEIINTEEAVVETPNVIVQKVAPLCHHATRTVHPVRVVETVDVKSGLRHAALAGDPLRNEVPKLRRGRRTSW